MLKVFFENEGFRGGPKTFRERIRPILKTFPEIAITNNSTGNFDIELAFIRQRVRHNNPIVLRLDGCYYRRKDLIKNRNITEAMRRAKYIIFQSKFSAEMCQKIIQIIPKQWSVIYNGIDLEYINTIPIDKTIEPGSFVSCSTWRFRPNKRPLSMIRGFMESNIDRNLYIIGEVFPHWIREFRHPRIHFLGERSPKSVISVMKACDYQIHLCHIDSCPNAVIEGLASGLNVLCTNLGGTPEIVKDNGVIMNLDSWDYKPRHFEDIDSLNPEIVAAGIIQMLNFKQRSVRPDLDIYKVARQYVDVLLSVAAK